MGWFTGASVSLPIESRKYLKVLVEQSLLQFFVVVKVRESKQLFLKVSRQFCVEYGFCWGLAITNYTYTSPAPHRSTTSSSMCRLSRWSVPVR